MQKLVICSSHISHNTEQIVPAKLQKEENVPHYKRASFFENRFIVMELDSVEKWPLTQTVLSVLVALM